MKLIPLAGALAFLVAGVALAHEGVKNSVVMARMNGMTSIAKDMKIIGNMAKGIEQFDATKVRHALEAVAAEAAKTPELFEANEDDPKSEARPEIWSNYEDFTAKAIELESVANQLIPTIANKDDLRPAMRKLAESCSSCHKVYRE